MISLLKNLAAGVYFDLFETEYLGYQSENRLHEKQLNRWTLEVTRVVLVGGVRIVLCRLAHWWQEFFDFSGRYGMVETATTLFYGISVFFILQRISDSCRLPDYHD